VPTNREHLQAALQDYLRRQPELEPELLAALEEDIRARDLSTAALLPHLVAAASSRHVPIFENVCPLLGELTEQLAAARDAVSIMADDSRAHVRFNSILCLGERTPRAFSLGLLRRGLRDRSSRVRSKAADWALNLRLRELIPDLAEAAIRERATPARSEIEFALRLLRDGYIAGPERDGHLDLTVLRDSGIFSREVSAKDVTDRGIPAIIKALGWHI
jgi:hypothetical protein